MLMSWWFFFFSISYSTFLFVALGIEAKVKSAFTRAYNKEAHMTPYAAGQVKKSRSKDTTDDVDAVLDGDEDGLAGEEDDEEQNEDPSLDAMIKVKKESKKTASSSSSGATASAASKKKTGAPAATRGRGGGAGSRGGRGKKKAAE
jgi:replication factor C subunit 1